MEPPPAPMVVTSMKGVATGSPHSTWYSVVKPYSPFTTRPTSVLGAAHVQRYHTAAADQISEVASGDDSTGET